MADGIATVTDRYDGFVLRSSLSTGEDGDGTGDFQLRIPEKDLQPALRDLAKLGDVRSRSQSGQDVTREFVSAQDRLQAARAERRSLLRRLEAAKTDTEAEAIRRRLDLNAGEVRGLRAQVRELRTRTDYATVSVTLRQDGDGERIGRRVRRRRPGRRARRRAALAGGLGGDPRPRPGRGDPARAAGRRAGAGRPRPQAPAS